MSARRYGALLLPRLAAIGELATRFITEAARGCGLNPTQWLIAFHLERHSPNDRPVALSPKQLAGLLMCPPTRVTTALNAMQSKGLIVEFEPSFEERLAPEHGRTFYHLTRAGRMKIANSVVLYVPIEEEFGRLIHTKLTEDLHRLHSRLEQESAAGNLDSLQSLRAAIREERIKPSRRDSSIHLQPHLKGQRVGGRSAQPESHQPEIK